MAILENLAQGFAQAANAPEAAAGIQKVKDDRRATAHEELQANTNEVLDEVRELHKQKADPNTDPKSIPAIDKRLDELQQHFVDLYHPAKNPGALQHLGGFLKAHSARQQADAALDAGPRNIPATPGEAKQRFSMSGGPVVAQKQPPNPIAQKVKDLEAIGVPHDEAVRLASGQKEAPGKYGLVSGTIDGQPVTFQHGADGSWKTLSGEEVDPAVIGKFQPTAKTAPGSTSKFNEQAQVYEKQWGKKLADWSPEELSYFNQKMAYDAQRSGQGTTTRLERDDHGVIHPVEIINTHGPMAPPVDPHAVKSPGEARKKAAAVAPKSAGTVKELPALSFRGSTPQYTKAKIDYDAALKLDSIAKQVEQNPNDAINQKRLAVALERASAGRFTQQALDYIIKAGLANSIEGWANKATTGALPTDVMRQLIDGAHQNLIASKAALDDASGGTSGGGDDDKFLRQIH